MIIPEQQASLIGCAVIFPRSQHQMAGTETIIVLAKVLLLCDCVYKSDTFHQRFNGVDDADVHTEKG